MYVVVIDGVCCMGISLVHAGKGRVQVGEALKSDEMLDPFFSYQILIKLPQKTLSCMSKQNMTPF